MALSNYSCDQAGCSQLARVFGLGAQCQKSKACGDHILPLIDKRMSLYDICAFHFIHSVEDAALYQHRKSLVDKGKGNIYTLESRLNSDIEGVKSRLQSNKAALVATIDRAYQEMELTACNQYEVLKQRLVQSRTNLETFLDKKDFQLSPEDQFLCSETKSASGIGLVLGDSRLAVATAVMDGFHLLPFEGEKVVAFAREQVQKGRVDLAQEACDYAQSLGVENPCPSISHLYAHHLERKLTYLLPNTATSQAVQATAEANIASSLQAIETGDYAKSLRKLQRGKGLLQPRALENPRLSLHLGFALAHFGKWAEADLVLKQGLDSQLGLDSALAMQLINGIIEAYYQAGKWQETMAVCEYALKGWGDTADPFEVLRTVYFLVNSCYYLRQYERGYALVEQWQGNSSPLGLCMKLFIQAEKARLQKGAEAVALYKQAVTQGTELLPHSFMTAYACRGLGRICEGLGQFQQAAELYWRACQTFSVHYPYSFSYAQCLENCAYLYQNSLSSPEKAEEYYASAYDILKEHFGESRAYAYCLLNLGLLYKAKGRIEEARQKLETALELNRKIGDGENVGLCESALYAFPE